MTNATDVEPQVYGLSGDHGWNDTDAPRVGALRSALLIVVGAAYFGLVWLLSGLAPLPLLASHVKTGRRAKGKRVVDELSASTSYWRNNRE